MPEPCFISSPDKEEIQNSRAEDLKPSCSCLHSGPACTARRPRVCVRIVGKAAEPEKRTRSSYLPEALAPAATSSSTQQHRARSSNMPETGGTGSSEDVGAPNCSSPSKRPPPLSNNPRPKSGVGLEPLTPSAFAALTTLPIFMHPQQSYYLTPAPARKQKRKKDKGSKEAGKSKSSSSISSSSSKKEGGGCSHDHGRGGHEHHHHDHHHSHHHRTHESAATANSTEAEDKETGRQSVSITPNACSGQGSHAHADDLCKAEVHKHGHHYHQHKQQQEQQQHYVLADPLPPKAPTQTLSPHHHKAIIDAAMVGGKPMTKWEAFRNKWLSGPSRPFAIMMLLTSVYLVAELAISVVTGSLALRADSFHMLSDVMALGTAWWAQVLAKKGPNDKATFGWGRAEVIGALVNCAFVLGIAVEIILSAAEQVLDWSKVSRRRSREGGREVWGRSTLFFVFCHVFNFFIYLLHV
ncbi:hypothetical protein VYU27_009969 [Nannochloropsis oceanica]